MTKKKWKSKLKTVATKEGKIWRQKYAEQEEERKKNEEQAEQRKKDGEQEKQRSEKK